jgi:hypothetical protein
MFSNRRLEMFEMCSSALTAVPSMPTKQPKGSTRRTTPDTNAPTLQGNEKMRHAASARV